MLGRLSVLLTPTRMVVAAPGRVALGVPTAKMRVLACRFGKVLGCTMSCRYSVGPHTCPVLTQIWQVCMTLTARVQGCIHSDQLTNA